MFVRDQGNNIYKITMIAGSLPEGFEEISVPQELQSEELRWLEAVLIPEVEAVEAQPEKWTKDGEQDLFEDPMDETWTYIPVVEAVEGVPAHWIVQKRANADTTKAQEQVHRIVKNAIEFGNELIVSFATENVLLGITADGMTKTVRQKMSEIISALSTGSLYDAIDEIDNFPIENKDAKYITDARLQEYRNKITDYLGI